MKGSMSGRYYELSNNENVTNSSFLINPLSDDIEMENENERDEDDDNKSENEVLDVGYCVRCRSVSNASSINLGYNYDETSFDHEEEQLILDNEGNSKIDCDHCHSLFNNVKSSKLQEKTTHRSQLICVIFLCLFFMVAEVIGGYYANSIAVVTDAAHLLSDLVGFIVSLLAMSYSKKKSNQKFNFGYYRIEILSALLSIGLVWLVTGIFVYIAVARLINQDYNIKANTMILVSALGVVINIIMGLILHGVCHSHKHKHLSTSDTDLLHTSHSHNCKLKDKQNINIKAAVIHVIGDLVQSIGVFVASVIIKYWPDAKIVDPICTFLFSIIVLITTVKIIKDSVHVLMEGFPSSLEYNAVLMLLQQVEGVRHVHSLHVWSLTLDKVALAVHLAVDDYIHRDVVLSQAQKTLQRVFGIHSCIIQVEKYRPMCMHICAQCRPLRE